MNQEWRQTELGKLCDIQLGGTPPRKISRYWDENKSTENVWLSISDIPTSPFSNVMDSKEYLSEEGAKRVRIIEKGTLLMSFKLSIGRICFAGRDLRTNEAIAALKLKDGSTVMKE